MTPTLRPLHAYEPTDGLTVTDLEPAQRWTSPRPQTVAQVTVEPSEPDFRATLTKMLEVLDGRRPIGQLRTLLADTVYEATLTRLRTMPPRGVRYVLGSMHVCWPAAGAVELTGRVETSHRGSPHRRAQAYAVRLERHEDTWVCVFWRIL
jgi:hypothetical protein